MYDKKKDNITVDELLIKKEKSGIVYHELEAIVDKKVLHIRYYTGVMAGINYRSNLWEKEKEELLPLILQMLKTIVIDPMLQTLVTPVENALNTVEEYDEGKQELKREINLQSALGASSRLAMEVSVIHGELGINKEPWEKQEVYPTESTYGKLERWEEIHGINPEIPYPKETIQNKDWIAIAEFLADHEIEMNDVDYAIYEYISSGTVPAYRTLEEVAKGIE